jgi:hypothetical protein
LKNKKPKNQPTNEQATKNTKQKTEKTAQNTGKKQSYLP